MSERTNETILKEILAARETAAVDLDALPNRLRPSHEIAAREARESLDALRAEYRERLLANATAFIVTGPADAQAKFAELTETGTNSVVVSMKDLHASLAAKIFPGIGSSGDFSIDHIAILNDQIWLLKRELGLSGDLRYVALRSIESVTSEAQLTDYIKTLMGPEMGGLEINTRYIANKLTDGALEKQFAGKTLPVVVINGDDQDNEAVAGLFKFVHPVALPAADQIDRAFAIQVFKEAKAKKQKANNSAQ